jgi:hypothetical protein
MRRRCEFGYRVHRHKVPTKTDANTRSWSEWLGQRHRVYQYHRSIKSMRAADHSYVFIYHASFVEVEVRE